MNKYNNKKITIDGIKFDSKAEAKRYQQLKLMEQAGLIKDLVLQPKFLLQPKFEYKNKCQNNTYRKSEYIADFSYFSIEDDILVIEDVKGHKTDVFKLKEKQFLYSLIQAGKQEEIWFRII